LDGTAVADVGDGSTAAVADDTFVASSSEEEDALFDDGACGADRGV
jgi:hypothetical protein